MRNLFYLLLAACIISCNSQTDPLCDETPPSPEPTRSGNVLDSVIVTSDGALQFLSSSAYFGIVDTLLTFNDKQLDAWEKSIGFNSMRKAYNDVVDAAYSVNTNEEINALIELNRDIVQPADKVFEPVVGAKFYRNILNRQGIFYVGGLKYHVSSKNVSVMESRTRSGSEKIINTFPYYDAEASEKPETRSPDWIGYEYGGIQGWANQAISIPGKVQTVVIETKYKIYRNNLQYEYYPDGYTFGKYTWYYRVQYDHYLQLDFLSYHNSYGAWKFWKQNFCYEAVSFQTKQAVDFQSDQPSYDTNDYTDTGGSYWDQSQANYVKRISRLIMFCNKPDYDMMTINKISYRVRNVDMNCGVAVSYNNHLEHCK